MKSKLEKYIDQAKEQKIKLTDIPKGRNTITIRNALQTTPTQIEEAKKTLLAPFIKDNEMLDIMTKDENLQKMAHRFITTIIVKYEDGTTAITATKPQTTPTEIIRMTQNTLRTGMDIEPGYGELQQAMKQKMGIDKTQIKQVGGKHGTIGNVDLLITFTKGR